MLVNVAAYGGDVALLTITAPGRDQLGDQEATWRWNSTAAVRWRRLHRLASQRARRRHGAFSLVAWTWEYQRRGALHKHAILGMRTPRERAAAHTYALALDELRQAHAYGFISDTRRSPRWRRIGLEVVPAERAARYLAKYLTKFGEDGRPALAETVTRPDVPALVTYISRELTSATGCTMRQLRRVRLCWVLGIDAVTGELLRPLGLHEELSHPAVPPPPARAP